MSWTISASGVAAPNCGWASCLFAPLRNSTSPFSHSRFFSALISRMPNRADTSPSSDTVWRFGDLGDQSLKSGTFTVMRPSLNTAPTSFLPSKSSFPSKSRFPKFTASISTVPVL